MQLSQSKLFRVCIMLFIMVCALRAFLPQILKSFALQQLNQLSEYQAKIESIDVAIYRGSYQLNDVVLISKKGKIATPFFTVDKLDLAIDWPALLHLSLVAKIQLIHPVINFVIEPSGENQQLTIDDQWQMIAKNLFPLNMNRLIIKNGEIHLKSFTSEPVFDIYFKKLNADLRNFQSVTQNGHTLSTLLDIQGETMDGAPLAVNMHIDTTATAPTFMCKASIEKMNVNETNNFLQHYTSLKVSQGEFSLYVELAAKHGYVTGYAKPILKNLKVINPSKDKQNPIQVLYAGAVDAAAKILQNNQQKTLATKVNISGHISNPDTNVWSVVAYIFRNAFIQALMPQIDNTIEMKDVVLKQ
jgi:hypothetical protein